MSSVEKVLEVFRSNYTLIPLEIFDSPYEILISTVLSSRTKDEVTFEASRRLFEIAPDFSSLAQTKEKTIEKSIYPVGFYKTKAKHIKIMAPMILTDYAGQVPNTRESLLKLPGVGRKTANIVLNRAFDKPAIAVDTHVHRITNLLGWVNTNKPRKTEEALYEIIDEKYWSEMNKLFVSIGRRYGTGKKLIKFLEENNLIS